MPKLARASELNVSVARVRLALHGPREHTADFDFGSRSTRGEPLAISDQWQRVEVSLDVTDAHGGVNAYIAANPTLEGGCFLVDDVQLFRVK